jgi:hypothetical protein
MPTSQCAPTQSVPQETFVKKTAFALSTLAAALAPVWAQSSVTVYGVLDGGVSRTTGLLGGAKTHVISGIMDGSRLGFKGNEDIGGGYRPVPDGKPPGSRHRLEQQCPALGRPSA